MDGQIETTAAPLKLIQVGNSVGLVLSKELLAKLRVSKGDTLYVVETPRGVELTPYDPNFAAVMEVAKDVMSRRRNVLHKLAQ